MKKLTTKLALNKRTVASLDNREMAAVKGGFTYSASLGSVCRVSMGLHGDRADCQEVTPALT